jgi:hypothetical protein
VKDRDAAGTRTNEWIEGRSDSIFHASDYCQSSDEKKLAIEQQLRLYVSSSQQRSCQWINNGESSRQAQRPYKGKKRATGSEVGQIYKTESVQASSADHRPTRPKELKLARSSARPGTSCREEQSSGYSPFHDNDFSFDSPEPCDKR